MWRWSSDHCNASSVPAKEIQSQSPCACLSPGLMVSVGGCRLNTQIPVEELLEVLKTFKRAEIEAEQTEDEFVKRHDAGRLREYQVWFSFSFPSGCTIHLSPCFPLVCDAAGLSQLQNTCQCRMGLSSSSSATVLHLAASLQCWKGAV